VTNFKATSTSLTHADIVEDAKSSVENLRRESSTQDFQPYFKTWESVTAEHPEITIG
jgi:hypothetical protein